MAKRKKRVKAVPAKVPKESVKDLAYYLTQGGLLTVDDVEGVFAALNQIVQNGEPKDVIAASKVLLTGAKMGFDMDQDREPKKHAHLHGTVADTGRKSVFEVAAALGIGPNPGDIDGKVITEG